MLIGALSLVIVVWLGTSMNFSRMSTLTGPVDDRDQEAQAGLADEVRAGLAEAEDDHALVLLDDAHRQVQREQDEDDDRDERRPARRCRTASESSPSLLGRCAGPLGRLDDERQALLAHDAHRCAPRQRALVGGPRGPLLAPSIDGADRRQAAGAPRRSRSAAGRRRSGPRRSSSGASGSRAMVIERHEQRR